MAHLKNTSSARRASVTVEMALLLPLIMLLSTGLLEYGWMFLKVQQLNSAARNGARLASLPDSNSSTVVAAINAELQRSGLADSGYVITLSPADISAPESGEPVSVTITVNYGNITLTGFGMLPLPQDIRAAVTMSKEGP